MSTPRTFRAFSACLVLTSWCVLATACGGHAAAPIPENALRAPVPRLVGRFDKDGRYAWSGSTIRARFTGSGLFVRLEIEPFKPDDPNFGPRPDARRTIPYSVVVDDGPPRMLDVGPAQERYELAAGLDAAREHVVTLTRETEAFAGVHQLLGLEVATGGELLSAREKPLKLLFVGDSISCGYGVLGADRSCKFTYATERVTLAYPWLASKALDAEPTIVCWSGRGVYRNYDPPGPSDPEPLMPALFERTIPQDKSSTFSFDQSSPAAVVINLGTNDFFADHERDGRPDPIDTAAFEAAYEKFLRRVREVHPNAIIAVATSPMLSGAFAEKARASLVEIVERRKKAGDERVDLLPLAPQGERQGCDGHPNAEAHRAAAKEVETFLRAKLGR